jgi:hypothetical protein
VSVHVKGYEFETNDCGGCQGYTAVFQFTYTWFSFPRSYVKLILKDNRSGCERSVFFRIKREKAFRLSVKAVKRSEGKTFETIASEVFSTQQFSFKWKILFYGLRTLLFISLSWTNPWKNFLIAQLIQHVGIPQICIERILEENSHPL